MARASGFLEITETLWADVPDMRYGGVFSSIVVTVFQCTLVGHLALIHTVGNGPNELLFSTYKMLLERAFSAGAWWSPADTLFQAWLL